MVGQSVVSSASLEVSMEFWETGILLYFFFFLGSALEMSKVRKIYIILSMTKHQLSAVNYLMASHAVSLKVEK